jgi:hypothetical protein
VLYTFVVCRLIFHRALDDAGARGRGGRSPNRSGGREGPSGAHFGTRGVRLAWHEQVPRSVRLNCVKLFSNTFHCLTRLNFFRYGAALGNAEALKAQLAVEDAKAKRDASRAAAKAARRVCSHERAAERKAERSAGRKAVAAAEATVRARAFLSPLRHLTSSWRHAMLYFPCKTTARQPDTARRTGGRSGRRWCAAGQGEGGRCCLLPSSWYNSDGILYGDRIGDRAVSGVH